MKEKYDANVTIEGDWWIIDIPQVNYRTQATSLSEVDSMARSLIAGAKNIDERSFDLNVHFDLVWLDELVKLLDQVQALETKARAELDNAARSRRAVATTLRRDHNLSVADTATLLRVTPSRVYQLLTEARTKGPAPTGTGPSSSVAGAGFEPTTSGL